MSTLKHPQPLLLKIDEVARQLAISRGHVYELMSTGVIPSVRIGRSRRVPTAALANLVDDLLTKEQPRPRPSAAVEVGR